MTDFIELIEFGKAKVETSKGAVIIDMHQITRGNWRKLLKGDINTDEEEAAVLQPVFSYADGSKFPGLLEISEPDYKTLIAALVAVDSKKPQDFH